MWHLTQLKLHASLPSFVVALKPGSLVTTERGRMAVEPPQGPHPLALFDLMRWAQQGSPGPRTHDRNEQPLEVRQYPLEPTGGWPRNQKGKESSQ